MSINTTDFELLAGMLRKRSGLVLNSDKLYLLESRLTPIARRMGLTGLPQLVAELRARPSEALMAEITEAMTTNESFFFRDQVPFDILRTVVLPHMKTARAGARKLRVWCAAASTGQEPYSIAMQILEASALWSGWTVEIIGTDICRSALERAKAGLYSQFEVQRGLPIQMLVKHFVQSGDQWQISPQLRSMVQYRPFNLLEPMAQLGQFDIIFCRNVLIYFDPATKGQVLDNLRKQLTNDGSLFLGAAETVIGLSKAFVPVKDQRGLYAPAGESLRAAG